MPDGRPGVDPPGISQAAGTLGGDVPVHGVALDRHPRPSEPRDVLLPLFVLGELGLGLRKGSKARVVDRDDHGACLSACQCRLQIPAPGLDTQALAVALAFMV